MNEGEETMKRRMIVPFAIGLGLLLLLAGSDSAVRAQTAGLAISDTGILSLGPGQVLRITVASRSVADVHLRFRRSEYSQGSCDQGVCALSVASLITTTPMTLAPGQGFAIDIGTSENLRVTVISDSGDLRINAILLGPNGVQSFTHMEELMLDFLM
jgi:hypothetical protein